MDETTAPVLGPGRRRVKEGFFWAIASDDRGHGRTDPSIVLFRYAPGREAQVRGHVVRRQMVLRHFLLFGVEALALLGAG